MEGWLLPLETFLLGLSCLEKRPQCGHLGGSGGRAGMEEMEVKAPAQHISKGMNRGCFQLIYWLAEATTSLSPDRHLLAGPKTSSGPKDMSYLPQDAWGPRLGCFKGNFHLLKPEGVMMGTNWTAAAFLGA